MTPTRKKTDARHEGMAIHNQFDPWVKRVVSLRTEQRLLGSVRELKTAERAKADSMARIAWLSKRPGTKEVVEKLTGCSATCPCMAGICECCKRRAYLAWIVEREKQLSRFPKCRLNLITYAPPTTSVQSGKLDQLDFDSICSDTFTLVRRALPPGGIVLGGMAVTLNCHLYDAWPRHWQPIITAVIAGPNLVEATQLIDVLPRGTGPTFSSQSSVKSIKCLPSALAKTAIGVGRSQVARIYMPTGFSCTFGPIGSEYLELLQLYYRISFSSRMVAASSIIEPDWLKRAG